MAKKTKIIISIIGIAILSVFLLIAMGLYAMEIEDHYGDHQDFYYKSRQGDIAMNRDTQEFKKIEKTWKRIYGIQNSDTVDLWSWFNKSSVEIYRPVTSNFGGDSLSYEALDKLIKEGKLELVIKE